MKYSYLISCLLLISISAVCMAQKPVVISKEKMNAVKLDFNKQESEYTQVQNDLKQLEQQKVQLLEMMHKFNERQKKVIDKVEKLEKNYDTMNATATGRSQTQLLQATKQMQEMQMSFNMQYLQLQNQMQHENRSFTMLSNIMKTKHDTVKNSISNIR
jgi:predicted nuclease with TOPRIM domain